MCHSGSGLCHLRNFFFIQMNAVGKIKPFAEQTVPFKPLKWPATPSLQRIFHLMLALCQMTVNHNVILFCQIYYSFNDIFRFILGNARSDANLAHGKTGPVMIFFHQSDRVFHNTLFCIHNFWRYNTARYRVESSGRMETDSNFCRGLNFRVNQIFYSHRMRIPKIIGCRTSSFKHISQTRINTSTSHIRIQIFIDLIHNSQPRFQLQSSCCLDIADQRLPCMMMHIYKTRKNHRSFCLYHMVNL